MYSVQTLELGTKRYRCPRRQRASIAQTSGCVALVASTEATRSPASSLAATNRPECHVASGPCCATSSSRAYLSMILCVHPAAVTAGPGTPVTERDASDAGIDPREILMTAPSLTPYDTGSRLEPQLRPPNADPNRAGRVDFDDESATVVTVYAERLTDGSHALHVELITGKTNTLITVDGLRYAPVTTPQTGSIQETR